MNGTVLAIDFNNLFYASFYTQPYINKSGMNVNAIRSFFFKLRSLKQNFSPSMIVIGKDVSRSNTLRRQIYSLYKAQRSEAPKDLIKQIPYAVDLLSALGFPVILHETFEGDDILGMISRYVNYNEYECIIVSSDRDFFQLVNEHTFVFNMRDRNLYGIEDVKQRYNGLYPNQLIDLKAIMGDNSDNIPGVYGIGSMIGTQLVRRFGSLDAIYENVDRIMNPLHDKLINGKKDAYMSYKLGTIITDYKLIDLKMSDLQRKVPDSKAVYNIIHHLGLYEDLSLMMKYDFL